MNRLMKTSQVKVVATDSDASTIFCWLRYKHVLTVGENGIYTIHVAEEQRHSTK